MALTKRFAHLTPRAMARGMKRSLARKSWPEDFAGDDYDWRAYSTEYRAELRDIAKVHTQQLRQGQYEFADGSLRKVTSDAPLHPNHRLLYESVLRLSPTSVIECGCGGGDHLHNLRILAPDIAVWGLDRSPEQLNLLEERAPDLRRHADLFDITMPFSSHLPTADVVFTQAVLMHIHTGNGHFVALSNLFRMSAGTVILMENWTRHAFLDDVRRLQEQGMLGWDAVHAYVRRAPELGGRPHLIVFSSSELELEPLTDYSLLTG